MQSIVVILAAFVREIVPSRATLQLEKSLSYGPDASVGEDDGPPTAAEDLS